MSKKITPIRFDPEVKKRGDRVAKKANTTFSDVVRNGTEKEIERLDRQTRRRNGKAKAI